jgi:hypothetical protein
MSFLFMVASLKPGAQFLALIFYIILPISLVGFVPARDAGCICGYALYTRMAALPSSGQLCSQIPQPMHISRKTLGRCTVLG